MDDDLFLQAADDLMTAGRAPAVLDKSSPERAAKVLNLSEQSGVPATVIQLNPEAHQEEIERNKRLGIVNSDSNLMTWIAHNPIEASAASDDYENLSFFGKLVSDFGSGWSSAVLMNERGRLGFDMQLFGGSPDQVKRLNELNQQLTTATPHEGMTATIGGLVGGIIDSMQGGGAQGAAMGAGAGALLLAPSGLGAAGGAAIGATGGLITGFSTDFARVSAGNAFLTLNEVKMADGQPLPAPVVWAGALAVGIGTFLLGQYGGKVMGEAGTTALTSMFSEAVTKSLQEKVVVNALNKITGTVLASGAQGGVIGLATALATQGVEELVKVAGGADKTILNDPATRQSLIDNITKSATSMAGAFSIMHLPYVGANVVYDSAVRGRQARVDATNFDSVMTAARESQLRERSPQAFQSFVQSVVGKRTVSVPIEAIDKLYTDAGVVPAAGDTVLGGFVPDIEQQMIVARTTGGDVTIPLAAYIARVSPEVDQALRPDLRVREEGLTPNEALLADEAAAAEAASSASPELIEQVIAKGIDDKRQKGWSDEEIQVWADDLRSRALAAAEPSQNTRIPPPAQEGIDTFHGSPHTFTEFDHGRMGTGEGAQNYGWGTYLAENQDVATSYQYGGNDIASFIYNGEKYTGENGPYKLAAKVTDDETTRRGLELLIGEWSESKGTKEDVITKFSTSENEHWHGAEWAAANAEAIKLFRELDVTIEEPTGNVYRVRVNRPLNDFIDLDKPLNEQTPEIQAAIERAAVKLGIKLNKPVSEITANARDWFDIITTDRGGNAGDARARAAAQEVSEALHAEGIAGNVYLDAGSRETGKGTRNFVVFSDKDMTVTHMNEQAVEAAQVTQAAAESIGVAMHLQPLFKDAAAAGMTEAEFAAYSKKLEAFQAAVDRQAFKAAEREVKRRLTKEWKMEKSEITDEVTDEISQQPVMLADDFFRRNRVNGQEVPEPFRTKLNSEEVSNYLNDGEKMPRGTTSPDGISPEEMAPLFGFESGEALVRALVDLERDRGDLGVAAYRNKLIKAEVDRRMEEQHGRLDENVVDEAEEIAMQTKVSDLLTDELFALAKQLDLPFDKDTLKQWAADAFSSFPIKTARKLDTFIRNVGKAGRKAELALLKGNIPAAFDAKQQQLLSHLMLQEAKKLQRELKKAAKLFDSYAKKPTLPAVTQVYTNHIHALLKRVGLAVKRNERELSDALAGQSLESFLLSEEAAGNEVVMADFLMDPNFRVPLDEFTVHQFRGLFDTVQNMNHLGRMDKKIQLYNEEVALDEVRSKIIDNLEALGPKFPEGTTGSIGEKASDGFFGLSPPLIRVEMLATEIDKGDRTGAFNNAVIRPIQEAKHAEDAMLQDLATSLRELGGGKQKWRKSLRKLLPPQTFLIDPLNGDGRPFRLTKADAISIALNFGNRSNISKFTRGYAKDEVSARILEHKMKDYLNTHLTKEDWEFVQGIWNIFKKLKPHADEMQRKLSGIAPDTIEASPVVTPHGTFDGGYFPIFYDPLRSNILTRRMDGRFEQNYLRATTPKGYGMSRTGLAEPLQIQNMMEGIPWKIQEMIHDITHREAVLNSGKVLYDKAVHKQMQRTLGPNMTALFDPWLKDVANWKNQDEKSLGNFARLLRTIRRNSVVNVIGFNFSVLASPGLGHIDGAWIRTAISTFRNPKRAFEQLQFAHDNSKEIQTRQFTIERDFREKMIHAIGKGGWTQFSADVARVGFWPAMQVENFFASVGWLAEYKRQIAAGKSHEDAVYAGDQVVRTQHGAAGIADMPAIMRGGEATKFITMFYGYFNMLYNQTRSAVKSLQAGVTDIRTGDLAGARRDFARAFTLSLSYMVIPSIFGYLFFNDGDEKETWGEAGAKSLLMTMAQQVPLVREAATLAMQGYAPRMPVAGMLQSGDKLVKDVLSYTGLSDRPVSDTWLKNAFMAGGYMFGLPLAQPGRTAQFIWDINHGKQHPHSFAEYANGIIFGKTKP